MIFSSSVPSNTQCILQYHRKEFPHVLARHILYGNAVDPDFLFRFIKTHQQVDERRFSGARRPHDDDLLPRIYLGVEIVGVTENRAYAKSDNPVSFLVRFEQLMLEKGYTKYSLAKEYKTFHHDRCHLSAIGQTAPL